MTPARNPREGHERVGIAVGPGLGGPLLRAGTGGYRLNPLEIQPAKIHCPPPREDWLSRERLNSWLERAASGRLGLIVAEAGFGKTTLLADWALHTRRLTTWYRLETDDRDWLTFIRHLVAGGRELDPEFAPDTFRLLHSLGPGGPTPADLTASIAREMAAFGAATTTGMTLLVDDYHVVDGHPDTDPIMRALLDRTGPGFSIIVATRSMPRFSVGRLRARGGVMTIDGEALCFDMDETGRLFRDAYRRPLDEDVVSDLHDRTEGWAALLTLVRTGLEDRESSDPRALVANLDASRGDLYEFLAEEVMGSLSPELQHFLTRVSVLMAVDVDSAILVDDRPREAIAESIRESERLGLLTRPDRESPHRFHHLVREFLASKLVDEMGAEEVRALHRSIADRLRDQDWYAAAWHYLMAGDRESCASVVDASLEEIIATGMFEQVRPFLEPEAGDPERAAALILRSRTERTRGNAPAAQQLSKKAVRVAGQGELRGSALLALASATSLVGVDDQGAELALLALREDLSVSQRDIALGSVAIRQAGLDGNLEGVAIELERIRVAQEKAGQTRYAGITSQNLATTLLWLGDSQGAYREASRSEKLLGGTANSSWERVGATAMRASAKAQMGDLGEARALIANAAANDAASRQELASEWARIELEYGSLERAQAPLALLEGSEIRAGYVGAVNLMRVRSALRQGDIVGASRAAEILAAQPSLDAAGVFRGQAIQAMAAMNLNQSDARRLADAALATARAHRSRPLVLIAKLLIAVGGTEERLSDLILQAADDRWILTFIAEEIARSLAVLPPSALKIVTEEATARPERWASALRLAVSRADEGSNAAASLLSQVGDASDAAFLRSEAVANKGLRALAAQLVQRVAPQVTVWDLGLVDVAMRNDSLKRRMRRSVLALLCFLASRPGMAASRDETLEALWPDLSPTAGGNSLHQAIYFLRRVFEPDYREGLSADYLQFDGEVITLNAALVKTMSARCWELIRDRGPLDKAAIDELAETYRGKYALDFAYEEWASDYRESLHAAVLSVVEAEAKRARLEGANDRTVRLAQSILAIDPTADAIELELILAYKASGHRAAAAEQYAHYVAFVRDELGVQTPPLDDLA